LLPSYCGLLVKFSLSTGGGALFNALVRDGRKLASDETRKWKHHSIVLFRHLEPFRRLTRVTDGRTDRQKDLWHLASCNIVRRALK